MSQEQKELSPMQRALISIKELRNEVEELENANSEPIAIIGMGCRFPGANSPEEYWELLENQQSAIGEIPKERWDAQKVYSEDKDELGKNYWTKAGFLKGPVDGFDAHFFGILPAEATSLDPQQRLLLEVTWEALENAGIAPESLKGSKSGVFVGIGIDDYAEVVLRGTNPKNIDAYSFTGTAFCAASGRLSFFLGLQGPSLAVDTACSSSLVSPHLAVNALRNGECNLAIAGGVHLMLQPATAFVLSRMKAVTADGLCKTFDDRADGYVRGEGCGIIVLKRQSDAIRDGDNILAVIRGSAVNHDGRSSGLTVPNGPAQQAVIRSALKNGAIEPSEVSYVEAHGTGTPLGDPIEVQALGAVLKEGRSEDNPVYVGSVKTNVGHLEAAAGIASIIKIVLAQKHNRIPAQLNFETPSTLIPWNELPVKVMDKPGEWPGESKIAGISSFGISGTNAHVLIGPAPVQEESESDSDAEEKMGEERPSILTLSAKGVDALQAMSKSYLNFIDEKNGQFDLDGLCYTSALKRGHHDDRLSIAARSADALKESLQAYLQGEGRPGMSSGTSVQGKEHSICFVFPGNGSQWTGMGRDLYAKEPVFRAKFDECHEIFKSLVDWDLLEELKAEGDKSRIGESDVVQPYVFAIHVSLATLLQSWGIIAQGTIGHSMGEPAAAYFSGALSLEDASRVICMRSKVALKAKGKGSVALVELPQAEIEKELKSYKGKVSLGAVNGPTSSLISGDTDGVDEILAKLEKQDVFCRKVKMDYASHSYHMEELLPELKDSLKDIKPQKTRIPLYSPQDPKVLEGDEVGKDYWASNLRNPVFFWPTVELMVEDNYDIFIEISPHPLVSTTLKQAFAKEKRATIISSLRRNEDEQLLLTGTVGEVFNLGVKVDWTKFYPTGGEMVSLPTYPWQHEVFWPEPEDDEEGGDGVELHPFFGQRLQSPLKDIVFEKQYRVKSPGYLRDHIIFDMVTVPGAGLLSLLFTTLRELFGEYHCELTDVNFFQPLIVSEGQKSNLQLILHPKGEDNFEYEIYSCDIQSRDEEWTYHAQGMAVVTPGAADDSVSPPVDLSIIDEIKGRCDQKVTQEEFYKNMDTLGYELGPSFQWLTDINRRDGETIAKMELPDTGIPQEDYSIYPGLVDACFQLTTEGVPGGLAGLVESGRLYIPFGIKKYEYFGYKGETLYCHVRMGDSVDDDQQLFQADIDLFEEGGRMVLKVHEFLLKQATAESMMRQKKGYLEELFYETVWEEKPREVATAAPEGAWLLLADDGGVAQKLKAKLDKKGKCVLAYAGTKFEKKGDDYKIDPSKREDYDKLLEEVFGSEEGTRNVVNGWSMNFGTKNADIAKSMTEKGILSGCGSTLHLLQAISAADAKSKLWLLTAGVQPVGEGEISVAQGPVWGMGKVISYEHPELSCRRVDVSREVSDEEIKSLGEELLSGGGTENEIVLRDSIRYAARMGHMDAEVPEEPEEIPVVEDGTYLITGGFGGLGLLMAKVLADKGAKNIALVGRRGITDSAKPAIAELEEMGVNVIEVKADVSDKKSVDSAIKALKGPPLKGLMHAAGILSDSMLMNQTVEGFQSVFEPKSIGAWNLHEATSKLKLDFFIMFSSAASVIGNPGQSNYAAANYFQDSLAHYRREKGLEALSINWGAWSGAGMAAAEAVRGERMSSKGADSLSPEMGVEATERVFDAGIRGQATIMLFTLRNWADSYPASKTLSIFTDMLEASKDSGDESASERDIRAELTEIEAGPERTEHFEMYLRELVAGALKIAAKKVNSEQAFSSFGVDSLVSLDVKNRITSSLDLSLSNTLLWTYPTIKTLAPFLAEKLGLPLEAAEEVVSTKESASEAADKALEEEVKAELDGKTEEELEALLMEELGDL